MKKNSKSQDLNRRKFLQMGSAVAASALVLPLGGSKVFGAISSKQSKPTVPMVTLNNGIQMPYLGFGTHSLKDDICVRCVSDAISVGFRLIDTATVYGNEEFVGAGIKKSQIDHSVYLGTVYDFRHFFINI